MYILNKQIFLTFYISKNTEEISHIPKKYEAAQRFPTLIINQHIRMKDHVTLKTGVMMLKIQLCFIGIKYIKIENFYLYTALMSIRNVSGYVCNHGSLRVGNETLRPLGVAMGDVVSMTRV